MSFRDFSTSPHSIKLEGDDSEKKLTISSTIQRSCLSMLQKTIPLQQDNIASLRLLEEHHTVGSIPTERCASAPVELRVMTMVEKKAAMKTLKEMASRFLDPQMYTHEVQYNVTLPEIVDRFTQQELRLHTRMACEKFGRTKDQEMSFKLRHRDFFLFMSGALETMHPTLYSDLVIKKMEIGEIIANYEDDQEKYVLNITGLMIQK